MVPSKRTSEAAPKATTDKRQRRKWYVHSNDCPMLNDTSTEDKVSGQEEDKAKAKSKAKSKVKAKAKDKGESKDKGKGKEA